MATITYEEQRTEEEKAIDAVLLARVKRGLAWLEETHGPGWEDKIDLKALQISDVRHCVLGQVYEEEAGEGFSSGYHWALAEKMGLKLDAFFNVEIPAQLGFAGGQDFMKDPTRWDDLTAAWRHVLTPRIEKVEA